MSKDELAFPPDTPSPPVMCKICHGLRGSLAGSLAKGLTYPLDRLKMIHQVKGPVVGQFQLRQVPSRLIYLTQSEGFFSLWKGHLATFLRTFPHSGITFYSFEQYHSWLTHNFPNHPWFVRFLSGGFAGVTSTCITYPLDVWNTRMAISLRAQRYQQVTLLSYEGFHSLYRGLAPTLLGIFPYAAISFFTYESLKARIQNGQSLVFLSSRPSLESSSTPFSFTGFHALICGGTAGIVSQTATYPLDTIRKFMQSNTFLYRFEEKGHVGKQHPSILQTFSYIYQSSGVRGFYNGVSLNWIKGFIAAGIAFSGNEMLRKAIQKHPYCQSS